MLEPVIRFFVARFLPAFVGVLGGFVAVHYSTLHLAFCTVQ